MKKYFLLCVAAALLALTVTPTTLLAEDGNPPHPIGNFSQFTR
jgi:hypothetical protein